MVHQCPYHKGWSLETQFGNIFNRCEINTMMSPRKNNYLIIYIYLYIHDSWLERKRPKIIQNHPKSPMSCWTKPELKIGILRICMVGKLTISHHRYAVPRLPSRRSWDHSGGGSILWCHADHGSRSSWGLLLLSQFHGWHRPVMACYGRPVYVRNVSWEILGEIGEIYVGCSCWWLARFWSWVLLDICWLLLIRFFRKE
jgi:hypothetical protein